jgi:hypothetical protein
MTGIAMPSQLPLASQCEHLHRSKSEASLHEKPVRNSATFLGQSRDRYYHSVSARDKKPDVAQYQISYNQVH